MGLLIRLAVEVVRLVHGVVGYSTDDNTEQTVVTGRYDKTISTVQCRKGQRMTVYVMCPKCTQSCVDDGNGHTKSLLFCM